MFRHFLVFFSLACALGAADRFDGLRASIRKQLRETGAPSMAVAVAHDGKIVWEEGFGTADRERRRPATAHTMYSLASISKPFTATALMLLVRDGKIDLDRRVNDYLGPAKVRARAGAADQATVRRVANHMSGLPLHYQFFYADAPFRPQSMDETILRFGNLVTAPAERYQYSNLGYGILDYVIARVSGRSYAEFMHAEVFAPLGLRRTSVHLASGMERHAAPRYAGDGRPLPLYRFDHDGASAIWSSAHDLALFAMFHMKAHLRGQKAILPDDLIDAMQKPNPIGPGMGYGIGWETRDSEGCRIVAHSGGMPGVATVLRMVPAEKLAIAVLSNSSSALPFKIADEIMAEMLPAGKPVPQVPLPAAPVAFPPEVAGKWNGKVCTYKAEIPLALEVLGSGKVRARLGSAEEQEWSDLFWRRGWLRGRMSGDLAIEETARGMNSLEFTLKLRGNVLNGAVSAMSAAGPAARMPGAVTQWAELTRH